jgi:hypothetical protein
MFHTKTKMIFSVAVLNSSYNSAFFCTQMRITDYKNAAQVFNDSFHICNTVKEESALKPLNVRKLLIKSENPQPGADRALRGHPRGSISRGGGDKLRSGAFLGKKGRERISGSEESTRRGNSVITHPPPPFHGDCGCPWAQGPRI